MDGVFDERVVVILGDVGVEACCYCYGEDFYHVLVAESFSVGVGLVYRVDGGLDTRLCLLGILDRVAVALLLGG